MGKTVHRRHWLSLLSRRGRVSAVLQAAGRVLPIQEALLEKMELILLRINFWNYVHLPTPSPLKPVGMTQELLHL